MISFLIFKFICWAYEVSTKNDLVVCFFGMVTFFEFLVYIFGIYALIGCLHWRLQKKGQSK
jgi:hypothetical protein